MMDNIRPTEDAPTRAETFDQAGIDAMFGFDTEKPRTVAKGLKALLEADVVNRERLPMLEVVCERMARTFATSMRNLTSDSLDVNLVQVTTTRFGDFMHRLTLPTMIGIFHVKEWENYGAVTVDSGLIYAVVDSLLGGRRAGAPMRIEGRAYTPIETMLVGKMIQQALDDFTAAFEAIEPITSTLERVETTPRFAAIAGPSNLAAVASFRIDMEGRGGTFDIVLPYATIETVRDKLVQRFAGEKLGRDSMWEKHMTAELIAAEMEVEAVLGERSIRVQDYMPFEVGQTISLGCDADDPIDLACNGVRIGQVTIGRRAGQIAVQLINDIKTTPVATGDKK
jgi:flagellar motor switch protein FliM